MIDKFIKWVTNWIQVHSVFGFYHCKSMEQILNLYLFEPSLKIKNVYILVQNHFLQYLSCILTKVLIRLLVFILCKVCKNFKRVCAFLVEVILFSSSRTSLSIIILLEILWVSFSDYIKIWESEFNFSLKDSLWFS